MTDSNQLDKEPAQEAGGGRATKKSKQKRKNAWRPEGPVDPFTMLDSLPEEKQQEIRRSLHLFSPGPGPPRTLQEARGRPHPFWDTQPVPKLGDSATTRGPILESRAPVREEPFSLPQGFSWDSLDLTRPAGLAELCTLLNDNYAEEDDNTVRRRFTPEYMRWALLPPACLAQWHCGVRVSANNKLVGFISALPADVHIYDTEKRVARVSFLCVHRKLRLKRMAPVLMRELARRVSQRGPQQALYTANVVLPSPISTCRYWHRSLNPRKLMDVAFPGVRQDMAPQRAAKLQRLPEVTKTPGLRTMRREDVPRVGTLLQQNLQDLHLRPVLSPQEVEHWLLPREGVLHSYVVEASDGSLTDLVTFCCISSMVLNHPVHRALQAAQMLYCVATATDLADLMEDALVLAKANGFDVFTALDVMGNQSFLEKLKFFPGEKRLHYYLYNWRCPSITADKVGFLLPS